MLERLGQTGPIIIAEMSGNHNRSLDRAMKTVEAAARAGVDALKLQTYTPETMTLNLDEGDFRIRDMNTPWDGESLFNLYEKGYTPREWHARLFERARELGLIPFSSPFDATAVDFLETLHPEVYKIASFENTDIPLIRKVASTGKPIIISTGMAEVAEIDEAVRAARQAGSPQVILLKCTSTYPASPRDSNLLTIPHLQALFDCPVGLSDHTPGIGTSIAAVALGAVLIERHFTLDRSDGGVDAAFSLEPDEMRTLVVEARRAWQSLGQVHYGPTESEKQSRTLRRSLYIVEPMQKGQQLTERNLRAIRPGAGLPPKYRSVLLGKRVNQDVPKGTPMTWDLLL